MRLRTLILLSIGLGATALGAGGLLHHFAANSPQEVTAGGPPATAPVTVTRPEGRFAFSLLEAPTPVPELSFVDGQGREMTLEAFEGRMVLLNIWATWCVPCREEMPAFDRLQARLGGPDFQVVPLSIDRGGLPAVRAFYEELGLESLGIYVDRSGKAARELRAFGIPATLLVDREGREIGRVVGPAEWDSEEVVEVLQQHLGPRTEDAPGSEKGSDVCDSCDVLPADELGH